MMLMRKVHYFLKFNTYMEFWCEIISGRFLEGWGDVSSLIPTETLSIKTAVTSYASYIRGSQMPKGNYDIPQAQKYGDRITQ
jgi:hypothetical protein